MHVLKWIVIGYFGIGLLFVVYTMITSIVSTIRWFCRRERKESGDFVGFLFCILIRPLFSVPLIIWWPVFGSVILAEKYSEGRKMDNK